MSNYFILQLHPENGVMIDSDAFLGAFSMDREGQRVKVGPWSLAPGHRSRQPSDPSSTVPTELVDQEEIRVSMYNKWEKYYRHAAGHIPYAVCKANGAPPLGMDDVDGDSPCASASRIEDESEEQGFEIGGIGHIPIETGIEEHAQRTGRPGGRPLKGKGSHSQDTMVFMVKQGQKPNESEIIRSMTRMIKLTSKVYLPPHEVKTS
jgi:hypothetical protein